MKFFKKIVSFVLLVGWVSVPAHAVQKINGKLYAVIASRQPVQTYDPGQKYDYSMRIIQGALYDGLLRYIEDDPVPKPWLAKSWDISDDATVYTFKLDTRAKFNNGRAVTAQAVKQSFVRTLKIGKRPAGFMNQYLKPENIKVIDTHTVQFTLEYPYAAFLSILPWVYVVDTVEVMQQEKDGDLGQGWLNRHAAGSGAFVLEQIEEGAFIKLKSVDTYWKGWPHKNHIDGFVYKLIRETASQRTALKKGEADVALNLTDDEINVMSTDKKFKVQSYPALSHFGLKFNTQLGKTADINLRKAIAYAYDYDSFIDIFSGNAELMTSPFASGINGHTVVDMPRKDLAKAKQYLAQSAYPNGGIEVEYVYVQGYEQERLMGLVLIDSLNPLNIKVKMVPLTWPNMVERMAKVETSPEIIAVFTSAAASDPDLIAKYYNKDSWGLYTGAHYLDDTQLETKINKARRLSNWDDRKLLYAEIQKDIVAHQPEVFGMTRIGKLIFSKYLAGVNQGAALGSLSVDPYTWYWDK